MQHLLKNVPNQRSTQPHRPLHKSDPVTQIKLPVIAHKPQQKITATTKQLKPTKPKTKIKIENLIAQTPSNQTKKHHPEITNKTTNQPNPNIHPTHPPRESSK